MPTMRVFFSSTDRGLDGPVISGGALQAAVTFEAPDGARHLALRVGHARDESADVPLKSEPRP